LASGQVKGTDFLHFYALARVGASDPAQFANPELVRATQLRAVADSEDHNYPPVYGPQVALALSPLAGLDYFQALIVWTLLSAAIYLCAVTIASKYAPAVAAHRSTVFVAAIGFPPFWYLLQYGQLSAVPLGIFIVAWLFLKRGNRLAAGVVLGLLSFKPPLFAPVLAVLILGGSWTIAVAMIASGVAELAFAWPWVGVEGLTRYVQLLLDLPRMAPMMAARPYQMHSLRAFWMLLIGSSFVSTVLYALTAACAIVAAAYLWRRVTDVSVQMSALLLATTLASPHLYVYDLVILAPAWIWLTDWFLRHDVPAVFGRALYAGFILTAMGPFAQLIPFQASVVCVAYLLAAVALWAPSATVLESSAVYEALRPMAPGQSLPLARGLQTSAR
jgi:hypothetical protein